MDYTPSLVWSILVGESEDPDEVVDVQQVGLAQLSIPRRVFIVTLAQGYTAKVAKQQSGLVGNSTRLKWDILNELTGLINGG